MAKYKSTPIDPLSEWQDLATLLKQYDVRIPYLVMCYLLTSSIYQSPPKSIIRPPKQSDVPNSADDKTIEQSLNLMCCHRDLSTSFDSPWYPLLFAMAHGKIIHKPPHALERLAPLMRRTNLVIRVESAFIAVFLVQCLDDYGNFVEIDRQSGCELTGELPEWLQEIFIPDADKVLEWKCEDHGNRFRCTAFLRKAIGWSWL